MRHLFFALTLFVFVSAHAQDDLLKDLENTETNETDYVIQTFKGTRVVNGHSTETKPGGTLEFIISHRFGTVNSGSYELWGLDQSTIRLGLEYGLTDRLGIAVGRSSWDKSYDGYLKYKLLRQSTGAKNFPFTMTLLTSMQYRTLKDATTAEMSSEDRLSYAYQALIARKFSPAFTFQVAPILVHRNAVDETQTNHDIFALGLGARVKVTRSVSVHGEYYPRLNEKENSPYYDAIGFGIDIETGGHVFQLVFTNSVGMQERLMVTETTGDFWDGDIRFGFNITRTFQLSKKASGSGQW